MILLILFLILGVVGVVATTLALARDDYRAAPTDWALVREQSSLQAAVAQTERLIR